MVDFKALLADKRAADLKAKIAAALPAGPSMVPGGKRRKSKETEEVIPELTSLTIPPIIRLKLIRLMNQHMDMTARISEIVDQREPLAEEIKTLCNSYGVTKAQHQGNRITYYPTGRTKIVKELLLAKGVSGVIIDECTTKSSSFGLRITPAGQEEKEETA